jgi:hypothetical protein
MLEGRPVRQPVKGTVDLDGAQTLGVVAEHVPAPEIFRVKGSFPVLV